VLMIGGTAALLGLLLIVRHWQLGRSSGTLFRVGVLLPLSGDAAPWGISMKEGIDLAFEYLSKSRSSQAAPIELRYEDDRGQPRDGLAAAQKLISVDHVFALIGVANSSVALAIIPVIDRQKIVFISGGASSPKLSGSSRFFFRTWPSDVVEAHIMARYAHDRLKVKDVAILYINNDYGFGLRIPFRQEFEKLGGRVVAEETFQQEATDFRTQLVSVRNARPDAVYLAGNPREMARCLKQARELGLKMQFLSISGLVEPEVIRIAGKAAEGVLLTDASFDPSSPNAETQRFISLFRQRYRKEPGMLAATGYDAMRVLIAAFDKVRSGGDLLAEEIRKIRDFPGAAGPISFDERGDVSRPVRITTVRDGQFVTKEYVQ